MSKENVTKRAFRVYSAYNPRYFPLRFLQIVFESSSPYFNLWMSSEIVTALYRGKEKREIYTLVLVTLLGNLLIRVLEAILTRVVETEGEVLNNQEAAASYRKTLSLDYDKIENPEIRHLRRKILENSWINGYGVFFMKIRVEMLMKCVVNILFCAGLFLEMLFLVLSTSIQMSSILLLFVLAGAVTLASVIHKRNGTQMADYWKKIGDHMLRENRLSTGYDSAPMDNRIYRQQELIMECFDKLAQDHLKIRTEVTKRNFQLEVPEILCAKIAECCSYLVVCQYCAAGVFPIGSIIKYVGYLERITNSIGQLFSLLHDLKNNEPFLETYLEFLNIENEMYQGSLAVEKRSDKKFEIEFKNVSFRYAGTNDDALKHISLRLKVGERLAVVGMNGSGKTTFIKLLCRLYDPTEGEIFMNDFNIRKYDYRQ